MTQITTLKYALKKLIAAVLALLSLLSSIITGGDVVDLSGVTAADYEKIKISYKQMILGPDSLNIADDNIRAKINSMVSAGLYRQSLLVRNGTAPWVGVPEITSSPDISAVYSSVFQMAKAYACKFGSCYRDAALLSDILYSLDWMYDNCYGAGVNEITKFGNWWDWEIGGPTMLVGTLVLIEDSISPELIDKYLQPVNYFVAQPERTSANLVDSAYIVVGAGALQCDGEKLYKARQKLDEVFPYVKDGDGFYKDGSYVMHVDVPYQGGYGTIMLEALSRVIYALDDTFFAVSEKNIETQVAWAFDSYVPLMYKGALPGMVRGRNICRNTDDIGIGYAAVAGMLRMAEYADAESAEKLLSAVKYYFNENSTRYIASSSVFDLCLFNKLANNESIQAMEDRCYTNVFPKMDRLSKTAENYAVGISMASKRISKYEAINNENGKGWYTGDGMLYIHNSAYDYDYSYWSNVNYYRLPGTTVTTRERKDQNVALKCLPNTAFAGGVSLDECAVGAMQLLGVTTEFSSTLKAKKAWFLFDDEITALGADINCSDEYSAETIIENRRLTENSEFSADGIRVSGSEGVFLNAKTLHLNGFGGIYLPVSSNINYKKTSSSVNFLELWIDHGKNFNGKTYTYTILPAKTSEETERYAGNPDIQILANNETVQAVTENKIGITGYVFWKQGSLNGIGVTKPCVVMTKETESTVTITVSDPTQELREIKVTLDYPNLSVSQTGSNVKCGFSNDCVTLTVNTCSKSGLGSTAVFTKN